jgi:signal peptidase I
MASENTQSTTYYIEQKRPSGFKGIFSGIFGWFSNSIQAVVLIGTILLILYLFVFTPHIVDGRSMEPNYCDKDIYFTNKLVSYFRDYKYGEVVTFEYDKSNSYIKRVVGVGGDVMRFEDGNVYRNGKLLNETYLPKDRKTYLNPGSKMRNGEDYKVPQGQYFVLGDNRPASTDSRSFLAIDPKGHEIDGKVIFVIWPLNRLRIFDQDNAYAADECVAK